MARHKMHEEGASREDVAKVDEPRDGFAAAEADERAAAQEQQAQDGSSNDNVELLSKIVAKDIVPRKSLNYHKETQKDKDGNVIKGADGEPLKIVTNPEPRQLYRVFGTVSGVTHGDSTYGQWTAFTGTFEAVRFSDRARYQAPKVFLQGASETLLLDAYKALVKEDPTATLSFAFDIGVKVSDKWVTEDKGNSYEYTVKTVFNTSKHDPLKALRDQAMRQLPALPPPEKKG